MHHFHIISASAAVFADIIPLIGCIKAAAILHQLLLNNVVHLPIAFFDQTPIGRILSRFSKDIDVIENSLPWFMVNVVYCAFEVSLKLFFYCYDVFSATELLTLNLCAF